MPDSYDLARLRRDIKPFRLHFFPTVGSTNLHAAKLRKRNDLFLPAIVLTSRQTAGRGRGGNTWFSTAGCITATFAFPIEHHLQAHQLPLVVGLALRNACAELTDNAPIQIKWPNDLLHDGQKLAGILCQRIENADLVGIGLNVNLNPTQAPKSLRRSLTSLSHFAGRKFDMTTVAVTVAHHVHRVLESRRSHTFAIFRAELDQHLALVGQRIRIIGSPDDPPITGQCLGIDSTGRLLVRDRAGTTHKIIAGQVAAH